MYAYLILVLTAAIWGFAFVAQRRGLESLDPFTFNALRFALGALCVGIFRGILGKKKQDGAGLDDLLAARPLHQAGQWIEPLILGLLLFCAASLQQVGMLWTGAGSAGFITGLYVLFVPLLGLIRGRRLSTAMIMAIVLSVAGMWLMNLNAPLEATLGNFLVLLGAVFWALHIQWIDRISKVYPILDLAVIQYTVCAFLSAVFGIGYHRLNSAEGSLGAGMWQNILSAGIPIMYAGVLSVGVAFTLQILAQKKVEPERAGVILCLEGVFAMLGGYLILAEEVSIYALGGAAMLFAAMLISIRESRLRDFMIDKKRDSKT